MWYHKNMKKNSGQVAVFILLVMLLGLTVGLSVMSRTLQDLKSSTTSDQSSRAFSAAEAGVETALSSLTSGSTNINGITVNYNVVSMPNSYIATIPKDEVGQIDLTGSSGQVAISWTLPSEDPGCPSAALELSFYTYNSTSETYGVKKYAYNPNGCGQMMNDNDFAMSSNGGSYKSKVTVDLPADVKILRIKPIYNSATVQVTGTFGPQSYVITSTGSTTDGVTRSVRVDKSKPALPPLFDYVLFGGTGSVLQ